MTGYPQNGAPGPESSERPEPVNDSRFTLALMTRQKEKNVDVTNLRFL